MAYQNVSTPRFYVNVLEWLHSNDVITIGSRLMTLPVLSDIVGYGTENSVGVAMSGGQNFHAVLNYSAGGSFQISGAAYGEQLVNYDGQYSGFRISTFPTSLESIIFEGGGGSLIAGIYYDMPNAPNLSLTMSREYGGTKEFTTYNGSSMSNTMWSKPPKWGDLGAWELGSGNPALSRSGRRTWDLKFSYMDDGDLWGSNQSLSYIANTISGYEGQGVVDPDGDIHTTTENDESLTDGDFNDNLLTDDNFFSQVWHKTLGGTLPFIFQPDGSNNNPDQFCIAKFKDNSLKATQSAYNVYDISLSIEEVW